MKLRATRRSLVLAAPIVILLLAGCSPSASREPAKQGTGTTTAASSETSSRDSLAAAEAVIRQHMDALANGNTQALLRSSTDRFRGVYTQSSWPELSRRWAGVRVLEVTSPGSYTTPDEMRKVYQSVVGRPPYQMFTFNVVVERPSPAEGDESRDDFDVTVVRESSKGDWLVYDIGR